MEFSCIIFAEFNISLLILTSFSLKIFQFFKKLTQNPYLWHKERTFREIDYWKNKLFCTIICIIWKFVLSLQRRKFAEIMNKKFVLSDKEAELIEGIRNYQRSYINCSRDYIFYLQSLFDELLDMPWVGWGPSRDVRVSINLCRFFTF